MNLPSRDQLDQIKLSGPAFVRAVSTNDVAALNALTKDLTRDDVILLATAIGIWMGQQVDWLADLNDCTPDEIYSTWQALNVGHVYGGSA